MKKTQASEKIEWAVCTNPIIFGEVLCKNHGSVRISVGPRRSKVVDVLDVTFFDDKGKAEVAYNEARDEALTEATKVAERVKKTGL